MSTAEQFDTPLEPNTTAELADWVARITYADLTPEARTWAKHVLLDWFGVTLAGASEPLVDLLVAEYADGASGPCTVVGRETKASLANACLINGATSHALDYDDVNWRLRGHPTVPVAPVVLALSEALNATGRDVILGLVVGTEAECLIGEMAGEGHYAAGYHATATIGTYGAAMAAARMMGLDAEKTRHAIGIAASQAAGLKANFGTMTKPLHAGKAAMNGLMAARLAARGFTANEAILECPGGAADTMMPGFVARDGRPHPPGYYSIQQTLFKYHAACYLTHASIEAVNALRTEHGLALDDLKHMTLYAHPGHWSVCNIPDPHTGLEIKFSIRHCAAMALDGVDTSALDTYSDANATAERYNTARGKITLEERTEMDPMLGHVVLETTDGRRLEAQHDVGKPATDTAEQWQRLAAKFRALNQRAIGEERTDALIDAVSKLENQSNTERMMAAAR